MQKHASVFTEQIQGITIARKGSQSKLEKQNWLHIAVLYKNQNRGMEPLFSYHRTAYAFTKWQCMNVLTTNELIIKKGIVHCHTGQ